MAARLPASQRPPSPGHSGPICLGVSLTGSADEDGSKVDRLLYAGNNLARARDIFANAVKHRPRIRLTIRQRTRVLEQWPHGSAG